LLLLLLWVIEFIPAAKAAAEPNGVVVIVPNEDNDEEFGDLLGDMEILFLISDNLLCFAFRFGDLLLNVAAVVVAAANCGEGLNTMEEDDDDAPGPVDVVICFPECNLLLWNENALPIKLPVWIDPPIPFPLSIPTPTLQFIVELLWWWCWWLVLLLLLLWLLLLWLVIADVVFVVETINKEDCKLFDDNKFVCSSLTIWDAEEFIAPAVAIVDVEFVAVVVVDVIVVIAAAVDVIKGADSDIGEDDDAPISFVGRFKAAFAFLVNKTAVL